MAMFLQVTIESGAALTIPVILEGSTCRGVSGKLSTLRVTLPFVDPLRGESGIWIRLTELVDERGDPIKAEDIEALLIR